MKRKVFKSRAMWDVVVEPLDENPRKGVDVFDAQRENDLSYHLLLRWPQAVAIAKYILANAPKPKPRAKR